MNRLLTMREQIEQEAKRKTDNFRHAVLLAIVLGVALITGLIQ